MTGMGKDEIRVIGFDADDTLWVNEIYYREAEDRFAELMRTYGVEADVKETLFRVEMANLEPYGYGTKAFVLSLVECAIELVGKELRVDTIRAIHEIGRSMLNHPIELLKDVRDVLEALAPHHRLIVVTKGDLLEQERKMKRSGIASYFHHIEIMSNKKEAQYQQLLSRLNLAPEAFLMIGNSLKSDILPPLAIGAWAIHVPYHITWAHEEVEHEPEGCRYLKLEQLRDILHWIPLPASGNS